MKNPYPVITNDWKVHEEKKNQWNIMGLYIGQKECADKLKKGQICNIKIVHMTYSVFDAAITNGLISLQTSKYAEFVMESHPVFKMNDTVSPHMVPPWVGH